jgi:hypothetical protein
MTAWELGFSIGITTGFMVTSLVYAVLRLTALA